MTGCHISEYRYRINRLHGLCHEAASRALYGKSAVALSGKCAQLCEFLTSAVDEGGARTATAHGMNRR